MVGGLLIIRRLVCDRRRVLVNKHGCVGYKRLQCSAVSKVVLCFCVFTGLGASSTVQAQLEHYGRDWVRLRGSLTGELYVGRRRSADSQARAHTCLLYTSRCV